MLPLKEFIKKYIADENPIISDGFEEAMKDIEKEKSTREYTGDEAVLVEKIKELIDTYVKPAVEMDGGNIEFKSFDKGIVTVILQGSCSG